MNVFSNLLNIKGGWTLVQLNALFQLGRNVKGLFSFLFNLTPLVVQRFVAERSPTIATWLDWTGGPWFDIDNAIGNAITELS